MIYFENLSIKEKEAIKELHAHIINDLPKDMLPKLKNGALLYRFLKARDFDLDKAEKMLKRSITWRKHFQLGTILEDFTPIPILDKYGKISHLGLDKEGNIVKYFPIGNINTRDILKCVKMNDIIKHAAWQLEEEAAKAEKENRQHPEKAAQVTMILNLDNLTIGNATSRSTIEIMVRLMQVLQNNYPEVLHQAYLINSPGYYVLVWSILKTMMSGAMINKIHIYGHSGWKEKLLDIIDADVLPEFLGGIKTDPDGNPLCATFVNHAGKISENDYLPEEEREFKNKSLVKRITIPPKQKKEITVHVEEIPSWIHWEFLISKKDIGFGVFYKVTTSQYKEILPVERYYTTDGVEKYSYKALSSGYYVIVFDNSYSWMSSKEVEYCVTVVKSGS